MNDVKRVEFPAINRGIVVFEKKIGNTAIECEKIPSYDGGTSYYVYCDIFIEGTNLANFNSAGKISEISEDMLSKIDNEMRKLELLKSELQNMTDYFASTMLGQTELAEAVNKCERRINRK